ncbi:extracellular solute-binding protein [Micromonospora sp. M12]
MVRRQEPDDQLPENLKGLQAFKDLYDANVIPRGADAATFRRMFAEGKVGMELNNGGYVTATRGQNAKLNFTVAPIPFPVRKQGAILAPIVINEASEGKDEAGTFIKWALEPQNQVKLQEILGASSVATTTQRSAETLKATRSSRLRRTHRDQPAADRPGVRGQDAGHPQGGRAERGRGTAGQGRPEVGTGSRPAAGDRTGPLTARQATLPARRSVRRQRPSSEGPNPMTVVEQTGAPKTTPGVGPGVGPARWVASGRRTCSWHPPPCSSSSSRRYPSFRRCTSASPGRGCSTPPAANGSGSTTSTGSSATPSSTAPC